MNMHAASSSTLFEPPPAALTVPQETHAHHAQMLKMLVWRAVLKTGKGILFTAVFIVLSWVILSIQSVLLNL